MTTQTIDATRLQQMQLTIREAELGNISDAELDRFIFNCGAQADTVPLTASDLLDAATKSSISATALPTWSDVLFLALTVLRQSREAGGIVDDRVRDLFHRAAWTADISSQL